MTTYTVEMSSALLNEALQALASASEGGLPPLTGPVPAGAGMLWFTDTPPAGWAEMNGQALSRSGNPVLFGQYGTTHGAGDGSTTFNLPDFRGLFPRVWDHGKGIDNGRGLATTQEPTLQPFVYADAGNVLQAPTGLGVQNADGTFGGTVARGLEQLDGGGTMAARFASRPRNFSFMLIVKMG